MKPHHSKSGRVFEGQPSNQLKGHSFPVEKVERLVTCIFSSFDHRVVERQNEIRHPLV